MNPWKLTDREQEVLSLVGKTGTSKMAARALGISHRTVEVYLCRVREKMGVAHTLLAAIEWDRYVFRRTAKHEVAE